MITHKNQWWWGNSETLIYTNGVGVVDIHFDYDMPNTGYINRLSVLENYRKRGIGKKLLEACEKRARERKMKFLQLDVQFDNEWLVNWYKRLGFEILSREKNTYVMIKSL